MSFAQIANALETLARRIDMEEQSLALFRGGSIPRRQDGPVYHAPSDSSSLIRRWQDEWPTSPTRTAINAALVIAASNTSADTSLSSADSTALTAQHDALVTRMTALDGATTN